MKSRFLRAVALTAAALGSTLFSGGGCSDQLWRFNPCGTILANCDPADWYALVFDGPDWGVDPTCSIPGQCGDNIPVTPNPVP